MANIHLFYLVNVSIGRNVMSYFRSYFMETSPSGFKRAIKEAVGYYVCINFGVSVDPKSLSFSLFSKVAVVFIPYRNFW